MTILEKEKFGSVSPLHLPGGQDNFNWVTIHRIYECVYDLPMDNLPKRTIGQLCKILPASKAGEIDYVPTA